MSQSREPQYRLAELIAALSLATDLGMGQPMEHALRTCLLSVRIGRELGISQEDLVEAYYLALLRFVGCTANAHESAAFSGGDEIAFNAGVARVFMGDTPEMLGYIVRHLAEGASLVTRTGLVVAALADVHGPETGNYCSL